MASSSSSITTQKMNKNDVFLSFYGDDTRNTFTSTLHGILRNESIDVFIDDQLKRGNEISQSLIRAIEDSTISVVVFSEDYASSRWCLDELVKIMDCKKMYEQVVLPVFYHVDPTHVRNQTTASAFGDKFAKLLKSFNKKKLKKLQMTREQFREKEKRWRNALTEAANIAGRTSKEEMCNYPLAEKVVRDILEILSYISPGDNKELVGVQPIISVIERSVSTVMRNVNIIGIWGMGGIGKTTIANAIFNKMRNLFEGSFFAQNIREESRSPNGLNVMRQELISAIFKHPNFNINSCFIKGRLRRKKVFIVFDDVTSSNQIEYLIEDLSCFGPESRVIITTRDRQVLKNCGVDDDNIHKIEGLVHVEALCLFSWYAFRQNRPNTDYSELSNMVVRYAKGVPLALKVLGSFLSHKPKQVWESAIRKLERIPHEEIQKVLQVSYDELDDVEKNIFLDIACFLKWENMDFVIEFLNACGFYAEIGISVLIDRCLITISNNNKITMHDLLQEMGWEIVRKESTNDPGKRSRLWYHEDIYSVLEKNGGITEAIEGICLDMSKERETIHLQPCALAAMRKLRFFKLYNSHNEEHNINKVHVSQSLKYVTTKLRYLCWYGYPLETLQSNFLSRYLVAIDLPHSNIEQFGTSIQVAKLKHIDLSHSKLLRKILDLSSAPNLESLILEGCASLSEISSSIQRLNKLVILNLKHCKSLHSLPTGVHLESLRKLFLSGCSNLKTFDPKISRNIEELLLDQTGIVELPPSIENLSRVVTLNLENCTMLESLPSNICKLKSVEYLSLSGCSKLDGLPDNLGSLEALKVLRAEGLATREVPSCIGSLHFLTELNLTNCCITELPNDLGQLSLLERLHLGKNNFESIQSTSFVNLTRLSYIDLSYCKRLKSLPELPSLLRSLDANSCQSLVRVSSISSYLSSKNVSPLTKLNFSNCFNLHFNKLFQAILADIARKVEAQRKKNFSSTRIFYPANELPWRLLHRKSGSSITYGTRTFDNLGGLVMCTIVEFQNYRNDGEGLVVGFDFSITSKEGKIESCSGTLGGWDRGAGPDYVDSDHIFLGCGFPLNFSESLLRSIEDQQFCRISVKFYVENLNAERVDCCKVKECGYRLPPVRSWKY